MYQEPWRPDEPDTCDGHEQKDASYPNRHSAERALLHIRRFGERREKKPCRSYLCGACGKWYLTSRPA
jgi:hypothetical protein